MHLGTLEDRFSTSANWDRPAAGGLLADRRREWEGWKTGEIGTRMTIARPSPGTRHGGMAWHGMAVVTQASQSQGPKDTASTPGGTFYVISYRRRNVSGLAPIRD